MYLQLIMLLINGWWWHSLTNWVTALTNLYDKNNTLFVKKLSSLVNSRLTAQSGQPHYPIITTSCSSRYILNWKGKLLNFLSGCKLFTFIWADRNILTYWVVRVWLHESCGIVFGCKKIWAEIKLKNLRIRFILLKAFTFLKGWV